MLILVAYLWFCGSAMNGFLGSDKGYGGGACFFGSIFVSPLIVWMYLVAMPSKKPVTPIDPSPPPSGSGRESK